MDLTIIVVPHPTIKICSEVDIYMVVKIPTFPPQRESYRIQQLRKVLRWIYDPQTFSLLDSVLKSSTQTSDDLPSDGPKIGINNPEIVETTL